MCSHKPGKIYAIADLHLDISGKKTMEVFGKNWEAYEERIFMNWCNRISEEDLVLIPGDISWALRLNEAEYDLRRLDALPGTKLLLRGNHDYWWQSRSKIEKLGFRTLRLLQNDHFEWNDAVIYGTRGWPAAESTTSLPEDVKIYKRELERLKLSLSHHSDRSWRICMLHYPPFESKTMNAFWMLLKEHSIDTCVYGHLHGYGHSLILEGEKDGIKLYCVSADYLKFTPRELTKGDNNENYISKRL